MRSREHLAQLLRLHLNVSIVTALRLQRDLALHPCVSCSTHVKGRFHSRVFSQADLRGPVLAHSSVLDLGVGKTSCDQCKDEGDLRVSVFRNPDHHLTSSHSWFNHIYGKYRRHTYGSAQCEPVGITQPDVPSTPHVLQMTCRPDREADIHSKCGYAEQGGDAQCGESDL